MRNRLLSAPCLSGVERDVLGEAIGPPKPVKAGADLKRQGEGGDELLIVTEGWACRHLVTRAGSRQIPTLLVAGDVANLDLLLFDRVEYGVTTLSKASVAALPKSLAVALAGEHPGIALAFSWLAMAENMALSVLALSLGRRSATQRLAHLLCELSVRLGAKDEHSVSFPFPLTQEQIGDALGLTSVHVNRVMRWLRSNNLIASADRVMVLPNVAELRRFAEFDRHYLGV